MFPQALREAVELLRLGAGSNAGLEVSPAQFDLLVDHYRLLEHWNRRINLTAIRDPREAAARHYGESLFLHQRLGEAATLVDVGSGGGFPGVPLAIMRPNTPTTLVESVSKKAAFLKEAVRKLPNVSVVAKRLEDWGGTAECAVMRAVAAESVLGDLADRVQRLAILGTRGPPGGEFEWSEAAKLPWGSSRRLWMGYRSST